MICTLCKSQNIELIGKVGLKCFSVTSDSRLIDIQPTIYQCCNCYLLQKKYSLSESKKITCIYKEYNPHQLSKGYEQLAFPEDGQPLTRTQYVFEKCKSIFNKSGKLLDIGTGNGAVLRTVSNLLEGWDFYGFDIDDHLSEEVKKIRNVKDFFSISLDKIRDLKFDIIVLWHVIEHVEDLQDIFIKVKKLLKNDGFIIIQVPDIERNPFDLAVIDHCNHFNINNLIYLFHLFGLEIFIDGSEWIHNCLTLVLKKGNSKVIDEYKLNNDPVQYLNNTINYFNKKIGHKSYSIFGTGMSSIWVYSQLSGSVKFFIDEDIRKTNTILLNCPIVHPASIDSAMTILMPFVNKNGKRIFEKLVSKYKNLTQSDFIFAI
jgi:2-polyprenyl-3-methyl-5-hydroxy-6-metoxy-1,4-benzoquinol methylase